MLISIFYMKFLFLSMIFINVMFILYKGECIVSYYHKFSNDNNYKLGENIYDLNDYFIDQIKKKIDILIYLFI